MFKEFEFCLPTLGKSVPADADWFHESDLSRSEVIRLLVSLGLKAKQK
jgi:hypothetical protein